MKRKALSALLTLCMIVTLLPAMSNALAVSAASVYVGNKMLTSSGAGSIAYATVSDNTVTTEGATEDNYNAKFENGVLTLRNFTYSGAGYASAPVMCDAVIYASGDLTIALEQTNSVIHDGGKKNSYGIWSTNALTINGSGLLTAIGDDVTGAYSSSHGIKSKSVSISGDAVVSATGGTANGNSYGIYGTTVTVEDNAVVNATGGTSAKSSSYGIYDTNISITGGSVNAIGGTATKSSSYGINSSRSISISGGTVIVKSGAATYSRALNRQPTLRGSSYGWRASADANEPGGYTASSSAAYKWANTHKYFEYTTQSYPVTVATKLLTVTAPSALTLTNKYTSAAAVIRGGELPSTVTITAEDGKTTLPCVWTFPSGTYSTAAGAVNSFRWTATTTGYDVNGKTVSGNVSITNKAAPGTVAKPAFLPSARSFTTSQRVTITCGTAGAIIHYTTNGTSPTASSATYSAPITLSATTTIKAIAVKAGMTDSPVASATYTKSTPVPTPTPTPTPTPSPSPTTTPSVTEIRSGGSSTASNLDRLISGDKDLTVKGDNGAKLVFDTEALKGIDSKTSGSITVKIGDVTETHKDTFEGKKVFTLTVKSGSETISDFGGSVTVSLPYTLKDDERAGDVTVWYLAPDGTMTEISCTYDEKTKLATFTTTHFSEYVVGVEWKNPFTDVNKSDWFYGDVEYANQVGLFSGTSDNTFSPDAAMTREMLWTVLGRLDGQKLEGGGVFEAARTWATGKGITDGSDPSVEITREQLVTILWRYAGSPASSYALSAFSDADGISDYAKTAMAWAAENGIVGGMGDGTVAPQGYAARAQVAAIMQRCCRLVAK